jgi:two-component system, cell cycle sensor histidine kinase and response regulator CckA
LLHGNAPKMGSEDPRLALTASLLRRLLQVAALVGFLYFAVGEPFLFANKQGGLVLGAAAAILVLLIPEWLRRKGRARAAAWTLVLSGTLLAAIYVFLSGGVRSPGCLLQIVVIQEATLLLGRPGALAVSLPTLALDLAYVVAAASGHRPPTIFPIPPAVSWCIVLGACMFAAAPLDYFLVRLGGALDEARRELARRREAEEALGERETAYRTLFEQSPFSVALTSADGKFVDVNENFCTIAGLPRSQVIGKTALDLGRIDEQQYDRFRQAMTQGGGSIEQLEATLRAADGSLAHALISAKIIELRGGRYVLATVNYITQRVQAEAALRESEARYRRIVDTTNEGIWSIDERGITNFVNRRMAEMLGLGPEEMIGRSLVSFVFPDDIPLYEHRLAALRRGEASVTEKRFRHRSGAEVVTLASTTPIRDEAGHFKGGFAMMVDITAQKRDQSEREELRQQLEHSQKLESIGRLAGGVAHDFNNLLTVINGYSDLLLKEILEADPRRLAIEEIRGAGERAASLTRQLLTFGRRQIARPRPLDLNALISGAERMLQRLIGEDILLATDLDPGLEPVEADPSQMNQVLLNLSVNARDAMPDGGRLVLGTANAHFDSADPLQGCPPGAYVKLTVTDTGAGMSDETMRHLFEPFYTTKPSGVGTGLGLATVYGIVKQSGGSIRVHSRPGEGCCIEIHLPVAESMPEAVPPADSALPEGRKDLTVLVVEDQDSVRRLASSALHSCGYNVLEAASGDEALRLAETVPGGCHLVVTDVVMPGMSGKILADELSARWPEIKVLFMSGYPNEVILRHGLMNGAVNYLEKPFTPSELAAKVRGLLG